MTPSTLRIVGVVFLVAAAVVAVLNLRRVADLGAFALPSVLDKEVKLPRDVLLRRKLAEVVGWPSPTHSTASAGRRAGRRRRSAGGRKPGRKAGRSGRGDDSVRG
jgi:hypothetical protein